MLEKYPGNFTVEKLRAMLFLEEDFNALHKINFNGRLMPSLEALSAFLQETIGGITSQAYAHLALSKKLISDIYNTNKLPIAMTCTDATNCHDRLAHP